MYSTTSNRKTSSQRLKQFHFLTRSLEVGIWWCWFSGSKDGGQYPGKSLGLSLIVAVHSIVANMPKNKAGRKGKWGGQLCPTLFMKKAKAFLDHAFKQSSTYASLARSGSYGHLHLHKKIEKQRIIMISLNQFWFTWGWVHCFSEPNQDSVNKAEGGEWWYVLHSP